MMSSWGAAAVEPWWRWLGRRKKKMCHGPLLVGSLMTLLLLAYFLFLINLAKLTAINNGAISVSDLPPGLTTNAPHGRDELFGGLLPAGMDRRSCPSRYELWRYYKHFPYAASPHLQRKLRDYEARHMRCAPGTPLYNKAVEQLRSGRSADGMECTYIVWLPMNGLGVRMLSMVSAFLYALLTDRVFLVAFLPDTADLFCEPFPGTTWRLPMDDFPVADFLYEPSLIDLYSNMSYTRLLGAKVVGPDANATAGVPAYVYLSFKSRPKESVFFCSEHQIVLGKVNWLLQHSVVYYAPSLYLVAEFQDELRRLFPATQSVSHLLSRYLFHPKKPVWRLVTRYYRSYLAPAKRRIGVQVRMFPFGSMSADDMVNQIVACSRQEHILPETDDGARDEVAAMRSGDNGSNSTAILVVSLHEDYYERLKLRYYEHAAKGGETVAVFQPSHEERQATGNSTHNQRALAEIYLLSFSEELLTSARSTFGYASSSLAGVRPTMLLTAWGHKIPKPPCLRLVSMEPCNFAPPQATKCRSKSMNMEDVYSHFRFCEDSKNGVKFFD